LFPVRSRSSERPVFWVFENQKSKVLDNISGFEILTTIFFFPNGNLYGLNETCPLAKVGLQTRVRGYPRMALPWPVGPGLSKGFPDSTL
jgi:hypothetical protein